MTSATQAVLRHKPDLGIVFDTDVDRSAVVASNGEPINSNRYIALMAAVTLRYTACSSAVRFTGCATSYLKLLARTICKVPCVQLQTAITYLPTLLLSRSSQLPG